MRTIDVSDVEYQSGSTPLLARVYRPFGPGPFRAVVSVHGGGWLQCDRTSNQVLDVALAERGILVFAIDFRMPPAAPYPASIIDINHAIRWVKAHAAEFETRPEWVGAIGTSSGGHQLLLSALKPADNRYASLCVEGHEGVDARLAFLALCWPVVDPAARFEWARSRQAADIQNMHIAYFGDVATMAEADPLRIVQAGQASHLAPAIVIEGMADDRLTPGSMDRFAQAYASAGGELERRQFDGVGHTFIVLDPSSDQSTRALDGIAAFVAARTQGQP